MTALMCASSMGHLKVVKALLAAGADMEAQSNVRVWGDRRAYSGV